MSCKWSNIESFRNHFYSVYPNSNISLVEFIKNKHIKVKNKYGTCIVGKQSLLKYGSVTIRSSLNKTEYFINQSKEIHFDKYNYDKVNWLNAYSKVTIYCVKHKKYFLQSPTIHLDNSGCPDCGKETKREKRTKSQVLYVKQLKEVWKGKYLIKENSYINDHTKILYYCTIQDYWFLAKPSHILAKHGCRKCSNVLLSKRISENPTGWSYTFWEKAGLRSKTFDSFKVYIIECWNEEEKFYKIGKTYNTVKRRFEYKGALPYNWKIINLYIGKAKEISQLESKLKSMNKKNKYTPKIKFSGKQECFVKLEKYEIIST